jgi:hypothetical protein
MTDSKIYNVLTHFDKVEQNRLRKYIRSPYFNVNETLMTFYDALSEHINANGKAGELTKEQMWTQLYEKETFNDVRFRKLSSDLLKLVEGFLAQQVYDDRPIQKANLLLEAIHTKKIEKLYNSAIRQTQAISEIQTERPASYYYHQFEIQKKLYDINEAELKRFEKTNVEDIVNNLDYFYLAEKLKWYSAILVQQTLVSHEYKLLFIDEIINHLSKHPYNNVPLIRVHYLIFLTHAESENELHYHELKDVLSKYWITMKLEEAKEAYTHLLSYCSKKSNQGNSFFLREYVDISKELLKTDILWADGEIYPWYFRNAILISLRLGEYEWAENFLNQYGDKLPADFKKNALSYNRALIFFYQKKYDKVISLLQSVEYDDLVYNLSSKSILLAVYYELDEDDALISLMDSFKAFLQRHKEISDTQRVHYLNLMKYTKKLLKLIPGDQKEIAKIKQEMEDDKKIGIASMKWVYEKLAELE